MSDVNKVFVMGRLTRNVETKTTSNGTFIANFSIATNRSKKNGDETWGEIVHFFNFSLYFQIHLYPFHLNFLLLQTQKRPDAL